MSSALNHTAAQINVSQIPDYLKYMYEDEKRRAHPLLFIGPTGVGKTDAVKQFAEMMELNLCIIHAIHKEEWMADGLPALDHEKLIAKFYPLDMWPWEPRSILFLDELNRATVGMLNALMEVVLHRKVGALYLPNDVMIVAAGNEPGAGSQTTPMSAPMVARFTPFRVRPSVEGWIQWAAQNSVHPDVIAFIDRKRDLLNKEDDNATRRVEACPNPRNWAKLSDILNGGSLKRSMEQPMITGAIGAGAAATFLQWRDMARHLPSPVEILSGKKKMPDRPDEQAVVASSVGSYVVEQAKSANDTKGCTNVIQNLLEFQAKVEWPEEAVVLCLTILQGALRQSTSDAIAKTRSWIQRYGRAMNSALAALE